MSLCLRLLAITCLSFACTVMFMYNLRAILAALSCIVDAGPLHEFETGTFILRTSAKWVCSLHVVLLFLQLARCIPRVQEFILHDVQYLKASSSKRDRRSSSWNVLLCTALTLGNSASILAFCTRSSEPKAMHNDCVQRTV